MPKKESKQAEKKRVQIPALIHLTRIGYAYFGRLYEKDAGKIYDPDTNILTDVFKEQFSFLNPNAERTAEEVLKDIRKELDYADLGYSFYRRLVRTSPEKLIDFENPDNNIFQCTAEFTCKNGQDEFRPDITLFVNGLPLAFVEVKPPSNKGGLLEEKKRMEDRRFSNPKFRRFLNLTQLMIFTNNMEYDTEGGISPAQGSFYCTNSEKEAFFSCFREENPGNWKCAPFNQFYPYTSIDPPTEKWILHEFHEPLLYTTPEYKTNVQFDQPMNRMLTSMVSPERLLYILKYGIAYVRSDREVDGKHETTNQKHIMRYQQMFAAMAVQKKLEEGKKSGVIWHTQGSGKTALAYYLHGILTDFYAKRGSVAKFYFIVDRLDLLEQAKQELEARGLSVRTANSKDELMRQFREAQSLEGSDGRPEITVVNIQRFSEDTEPIRLEYATHLQRIFIIDEAHRSYNPKGSFLGNLFRADPDSVKIALTGTPLLKEERASRNIFGNYIHIYYYDKSIQDGYTLKIMREEIETSYREKLGKVMDDLRLRQKDVRKQDVLSHPSYVKALLRYILDDMQTSRLLRGDPTLGGMVVASSSEQAKKMYELFESVQAERNADAAHPATCKAALILYDEGDKETRGKMVTDFKKNGAVDILIVYNMLLTGFDAPRLKRLYLGRQLKDHTLLQAITRVNRPYKDHHYGYIIDFADIKENFEKTNERYLAELNQFSNPDEIGEENMPKDPIHVFADPEELIGRMKEAAQALFLYSTDNFELFSQEIRNERDKGKLIALRKILRDAQDGYHLVRTFGDDALKAKFQDLSVEGLPDMIAEIGRQIDLMNLKEGLKEGADARDLIRAGLEDIEFFFTKKSIEELSLQDGEAAAFQTKWKRAVRAFGENSDPEDEEYITLWEAFTQFFHAHGFKPQTREELEEYTEKLDGWMRKLAELHRKNENLSQKYGGDDKYMHIHKRLRKDEKGAAPFCTQTDPELCEILNAMRKEIDLAIYRRNDITKSDAYFTRAVKSIVTRAMNDRHIDSEKENRDFLTDIIVAEYIESYGSSRSR